LKPKFQPFSPEIPRIDYEKIRKGKKIITSDLCLLYKVVVRHQKPIDTQPLPKPEPKVEK
jgi:hypothetical protein